MLCLSFLAIIRVPSTLRLSSVRLLTLSVSLIASALYAWLFVGELSVLTFEVTTGIPSWLMITLPVVFSITLMLLNSLTLSDLLSVLTLRVTIMLYLFSSQLT